MKVLIACEFSGKVRDAFARRGHDAWSCDLLASETSGNHIVGDVRDVLEDEWDLMIAHPPCTHLCTSGAAWFYRKKKEQRAALEFVRDLLNAPIDKIGLENPVGIIHTRIGQPHQVIQPFEFGDPDQKTTCLWLKNLPPLRPTRIVKPKLVKLKNDDLTSDFHRRTFDLRGKERGRVRSVTFTGIAEAMADQWGYLPTNYRYGLGFTGKARIL